jgi:hypothetical protein
MVSWVGPVLGAGVMAKRSQGRVKCEDRLPAFLQQLPRGWRCCVPALLPSSALRFSLAICSLATFPWPPPPPPPSTPSPKPPPPPIFFRTTLSFIPIEARSSRKSWPFFQNTNNRLFRTVLMRTKRPSWFFCVKRKRPHSSTRGLGSGLGRVHSKYSG